MTIFYFLLFFLLSLLITAAGNSLVLNFAKTLGIRNKNDITVRWSNESKPSLGGVSMFIVFVLSGFSIALLFNEELKPIQTSFLGLLFASSLAFTMGISDDAFNTKPWFKLFIQIFCGLIFVFSENKIGLFQLDFLDSLVTVFWVVLLMNSLNMLDNMDGITGTTTFFVLFTCLIVYFLSTGFFLSIWSLLLVTSLGIMVGFLLFNVHPSKLFMGDGGSQFIGVLVAFFTIKILFQETSQGGENIWLGPILALVSLAPAGVDTLTVVINRLKKGSSPMIGGKDHTTHHLVYSGKNDIQVWYIFTILGALSSAMATFVFYQSKHSFLLPVTLGLLFFVCMFWYLYRNTIRYKQNR